MFDDDRNSRCDRPPRMKGSISPGVWYGVGRRLGLPADTENMMLDKAVDVPTRVRLKVNPVTVAAGGFHSLVSKSTLTKDRCVR
jgi:hypothetical protein